jgi:hypothetical protein
MKLIIVLIAILRASLGNICPQKFYNIKRIDTLFKGPESYLKPSQNFPNTDNWVSIHSLVIQNIKETGEISLETIKNTGEIDSKLRFHSLSSNLVCREITADKTKTTNKCLLQLITLELNVLLFIQISFQYDIPKNEDDQCKVKLNALICARTCEIENIEDYFHIFSIPVIGNDGNELKLKFNTRARLFEVDGKSVENESKITIQTTEVIISIEDQHYKIQEKDDSCFSLLTFIKKLVLLEQDLALQQEPQREGSLTLPYNMVLQGANSDVDSFYYYRFKKIENGKRILTDAHPLEGKVNLSSLDEIQIGDTKFSLTEYEEMKDFPQYQKYNINLVVIDKKEKQTFSFYVNFRTSELFEAMKKRFSLHTSCSRGDSLNYYKLIDLQNNMVLQDSELNGGAEKLIFSNNNFVVDKGEFRKSSLYSIPIEMRKI